MQLQISGTNRVFVFAISGPRLQHFINAQPSGARCPGSTAVPARSSMRDWMGFSPLLNNVTQIEMVGPGGLQLPHSHLQWSHVMKSGDEAVPEAGRGVTVCLSVVGKPRCVCGDL